MFPSEGTRFLNRPLSYPPELYPFRVEIDWSKLCRAWYCPECGEISNVLVVLRLIDPIVELG